MNVQEHSFMLLTNVALNQDGEWIDLAEDRDH
jgi:hypothetical protein